jgi:putative IMPACT (imprinted ancient) family translation regulator
VRAVLEVLPLAEKIPTHTVMIALPYSHYERVKLLVLEYQGKILDETFEADVTVSCQFATESFPVFQEALSEMTHGTLSAEIIETNPETIMPIGAFLPSNEVKL